jgi:hypothetical protein
MRKLADGDTVAEGDTIATSRGYVVAGVAFAAIG